MEKKQKPEAQDFLPEAQLSSRILAGLLARFGVERLPILMEQWQKNSTL